jgi:hypothetical protein
VLNTHYQAIFLAPLPRRKKISAREVYHSQSFTLLLFCFILFLLASFYQKYKKISSFMVADEGMTPRSSIFAYPVPAKEEARSKDTRSPQGPTLRLGVEGKKLFVNPNWLHI